jgi:hypothetical protein
MAKMRFFFKKNEWTDVELNRWFEESDLDVENLAGSADRLWRIGWTRIL